MKFADGFEDACLCFQQVTDWVRYICKACNCAVVNYIDDFAGAGIPERAKQVKIIEFKSKSVSYFEPKTKIL